MLTFLSPSPLPVKRPRLRRTCPQASLPTADASLPLPIPQSADTACGFATLLGPSNSGKSTLLNNVLGQKLAIVTPKVQTTRCRITGIFTKSTTQVVFFDTPGVFIPKNRLSRAMVKAAWSSHESADAVIIILDAAYMYNTAKRRMMDDIYITDAVSAVLERVGSRTGSGSVLVCANKIDCVAQSARNHVMHRLRVVVDRHDLEEAPLLPISARKGDGVPELVDWVVRKMPRGPWLYPEDDLTDMPSRLLAAEVVREKAFMILRNELPYEIAVETVEYKSLRDGSTRIVAEILVARNSQKRIVTGTGGAVVREIGIRARQELMQVLGGVVHLMIKIKVKGKWKDDRRMYEPWGLDYNA